MWVPSSLTLVLSLDYCVCNNFNGFVFLMDINCVVWEVETVYRCLCMCVCMCMCVCVCVYMYVCMYICTVGSRFTTGVRSRIIDCKSNCRKTSTI